jgi:hypothetical protein
MKRLPKWERVLAALLDGRSFNRFEAEVTLSDHCLHSTIATIQAKGVPVSRRSEWVPGYAGSPTKCCRYWLDRKHYPAGHVLLQGGDPSDPNLLAIFDGTLGKTIAELLEPFADESAEKAIADLLEPFADESAEKAIADLLEPLAGESADDAIADLFETFGTDETAEKALADLFEAS